VSEAALTQVGDLDQLLGAAVAGELDDIHQRGVVILIGDGSVLQTGDDAVVLVHAAGGQAHGQTHALISTMARSRKMSLRSLPSSPGMMV